MKIKIVYIIGSLDIGGAEGHIVEIASRLDRARFDVKVFTLTHAGMLAGELEKKGVNVIAPLLGESFQSDGPVGTAIRVLRSTMALLYFLWRERPEIIHCYLPLSYLVGGICGILTNVPIRIMSRRSLNVYQKKHFLMSQIEYKLHGRMHRIIANSKAVLRQLIDEGVQEEQLRIIYNGVDTRKFREQSSRDLVRKKVGVDPDAFVVIVVANLIAYKGHEDLLVALAKIRTSMTIPWELLCVGKPLCLQQHLESKSQELGIQSNVRFLGEQRERIPDLLFSADVGVLCSHQEGFSNSLLEGMATGLPMVVTDVGGNTEAVVDGETGIVVPPNCPGKLGEAILNLANDKEKRQCMGVAGRLRAQQMYSVEACVKEYGKLYEELLQERYCVTD